MIGSLFKAVVGVVVETPVAIVADTVNVLSGATAPTKPLNTTVAVTKVVDNVAKATGL